MSSQLPSGTVTFLFSDIEGSTALSREHGLGYGDLRAEHRRVLREVFSGHGGSVLDTEGDAFFVVFGRALDAVAAAVEVQRALASGPVRVRVGIHTTEPHLHEEGYVGVGVSRAARICAAAHGGQVVLSSVTAGIIQDLDGLGFRLHDIGEHRLKDMAGPERLFQVDADGLSTGFPPLRGAATPGSIGTLLVTDLAGFGRIMREQGDDAAADVAAQYQTIVDQSARASGGYLAERVADHSLCVFVAPEQALAAAAAVRSVLAERGFVVQAAVHTGRLARPAEGVFGSPAIRAMRLCGSCEPGQILVSHATGALLEGAVLDGLALRDLGERALPGTDEPPSRVYELVVT